MTVGAGCWERSETLDSSTPLRSERQGRDDGWGVRGDTLRIAGEVTWLGENTAYIRGKVLGKFWHFWHCVKARPALRSLDEMALPGAEMALMGV